jgi:lipid-binding SYLF domain-containing protein
MSTLIRNAFCLGFALLAISTGNSAHAEAAREEAKLLVATEVLEELRGQRDQLIPERLLQRAYGIAVIPSVTKVAFILGGRRGNGVLVVRDSRGHFTNPLFVNLTGGSVGWQFGAQETDIVLVFTTRRGVEGIASGKLVLGVGASVAAGPLGRQGEAAAGTDAEVYAYSRARGLFLGVALDGTAITMNHKSNRAFYNNRDVLPSEIMSGAVRQNSENARRFLSVLAASTGESATNTGAGGTSTTAPNGNGQNGSQGGGATSGDVKTFPMEDPTPGKEPAR